MRKLALAICLLVLATGYAVKPAHAQLEQQLQDLQAMVDPSQLQNMTTADWTLLGLGALAGAGVGFVLIETGLLPAMEILGLTEQFLGPTAGAIAGAALARMGYLDGVQRQLQ